MIQGSAAISIIYCPSLYFPAHILKLLTPSQTFKRSENIRSKVIQFIFKGLNYCRCISTEWGILRLIIVHDSFQKLF